MNLRISRTQLLGLAAFSVAGLSANAQSALSQYGEIVHAVGDAVPPAVFGVTPAPGAIIFATSNFDSPVIDQNGTIVYRARFTGGGSTPADDRAIFMGRANGDLRMVVRAGDQAPGCAPGTLLRSSSATTGSAGLCGSGGPVRISPFNEFLYFSSSLYDLPGAGAATPTTSDTALFWGLPGSILLLAREGEATDPSLALPGTFWGSMAASLQNNCINAAGRVVFESTLTGAVMTADDACMVTGTPGALELVTREGEVLGGGEVVIGVSGNTMSFFKLINESGQVLHERRFSTTLGTANTSNDRALAIWTPGLGNTIIAREGDQAPGLPVGVLFATPALGWAVNTGNTGFTNGGKTVIQAQLDGGGTTVGVDDYALYYGGIGGMNLVMRRGDPCPGLGGGELFSTANTTSLTCNDLGQVCWFGSLTGPGVTTTNDSSLWLGTIGNLQMIAREGDPVPNMGAFTFGAISQPARLNGRGHLIWQADVNDGATFKSVWFGYTPERGLYLLLDVGDTFTTSLGTDTFTSVSSTAGFTSGDGGQCFFNNNGDFVVRPGLGGALTAAILRGHVGSMVCEPSSVPAAGGVPQNFHIDAGPGHPFEIYAVLATSLGTRPGFFSPFGPQNIPLNPDALWTDLSLNAANSVVWVNNLGITDGNGKGIGAAGFVMPPGYPGFAGTTLHHACVLLDFSLNQTHVSEPSALKLY